MWNVYRKSTDSHEYLITQNDYSNDSSWILIFQSYSFETCTSFVAENEQWGY